MPKRKRKGIPKIERTAFHEAGHVVMAFRRRLRQGKVTIVFGSMTLTEEQVELLLKSLSHNALSRFKPGQNLNHLHTFKSRVNYTRMCNPPFNNKYSAYPVAIENNVFGDYYCVFS